MTDIDAQVNDIIRGPDRYGSNFSCHCCFGRINPKCTQKHCPVCGSPDREPHDHDCVVSEMRHAARAEERR